MTTLYRLDPWRQFNALQRELANLYGASPEQWTYGPAEEGAETAPRAPQRVAPTVDIKETADELMLQFDLPGVHKKDIDIHTEGYTLTVRAERRLDEQPPAKGYHRRERFAGTYERSFTLSSIADPEKLSAKYDNGVLTVHIPKRPESKPRKIQVK